MPRRPIDRAVPVPTSVYNSYPFESMKVGDSFFVAPRQGQSIHSVNCSVRRCSKLGARAFKEFVIRIDRTGSRPGVRCWRIK